MAYQPALDGLRALAVASVVAYHFGYGWARGGYLGVDTFFVLSGFLITGLLLAEHRGEGRIDLKGFWARRARRLLPALFVVLAAIAAYARWWMPAESRGALRGDGLAALFYSANWRFIFEHSSYFSLFAAPSMLEHTWSLAIEEQFYLLWPLAVVGCLALGRGRRAPLAALATACVIASAVEMAHLAGTDPSRAYFGTDTRVHSLLVGALLALVLERRPTSLTEAGGKILRGAGTLALVAVVAAYVTVGDGRLFMYRGGFLLFALAVAAVISAAVQPRGPVRALLSVAPLVWIGTISYGLYLWHWPVQLVLTPHRTHLDGVVLDLARVGVTVVLAVVSYFVVELPIRRGVVLRGRVALPGAVALAGALAVAVLVATEATTVPISAAAAPAPVAPPTSIPVSATLPVLQTLAPVVLRATIPPPPPPKLIGVVGDSVAASLTPGLTAAAGSRGIPVVSAAIKGCGATAEFALDDEGHPFDWSDKCVTYVPEHQRQLVAQSDPDLIIWLSSWETSDRLVNGQRVRFGTPESDASILDGMADTLARVTAGGARVVMLTLPPRSARLDGIALRDGAAEAEHLDELIMDFAFAHADQVQLIDFANIVCHGGAPCPNEIDGKWMRPDGMHFTDETSVWPATRLLDILLATPG